MMTIIIAIIIEWYEDYHKRKAQKASIKEELMPIAWHPSRFGIGVFLKTKRERRKIFF